MQTLQTLNHRAQLVALEAEHNPSVLGVVKNVYADVTKAFSGFAAQFAPNEPALNLNAAQRRLVGELTRVSYVKLDEVPCAVPEGLKVAYIDYIAALKPAVDRTTRLMDNFLGPFSSFLASLVNDHMLASTAGGLSFLDSHVDQERTTMNKKIGACFASGSSEAIQPYGKVVARNNDWAQVFHDTDALVQSINRVNRAAVIKKMNECVELMEILKRQLEAGRFGDMSPAVASNLAGGAYQVACELEFYSVTYYKTAALAGALNRTVTDLLSHIGNMNTAKAK